LEDFDMSTFVSKHALAEQYGVHEGTIDRWVRDGRLPRPVKIGGKKGACRWPQSIIERFEAELTEARP
jgi:predicted DNA-binding transcriptional regulator AlpA